MALSRIVEMLAIGDELLLGIRANGHLVFIGEQLAAHRLPVGRCHEMCDTPQDISELFGAAWRRADLVITTGGLGPTTDDLTRETIAEVVGRRLVHNAAVEQDIRQFFAARGREPTANNFRQCAILEGAEVLPNPNGTAPGQWLAVDGKLLIMLPGPAYELRPMFLNYVLPRLIAEGWASPAAPYVQLRTMGIGESQVGTLLEPLFEPYYPRLHVGYCAHRGMVDVRLSADPAELDKETLQRVVDAARAALGQGFVGFGNPDPACCIIHHLRRLGRTLAVAESCTGGLLASRFTDVAGASKAFMGGVVCYRNEAKEGILDIPACLIEQHGAVSSECTAAMATAAAEKFEADYAVSITGYAGPDGGRDPVGTVYIGFHAPEGVWVHKALFPGTRTEVKERAVVAALDFVRRKVREDEAGALLDSICREG
jgi:nicotinamide-nucleotide amidase